MNQPCFRTTYSTSTRSSEPVVTSTRTPLRHPEPNRKQNKDNIKKKVDKRDHRRMSLTSRKEQAAWLDYLGRKGSTPFIRVYRSTKSRPNPDHSRTNVKTQRCARSAPVVSGRSLTHWDRGSHSHFVSVFFVFSCVIDDLISHLRSYTICLNQSLENTCNRVSQGLKKENRQNKRVFVKNWQYIPVMYSVYCGNKGASLSVSDVDRYIIITELQGMFSILRHLYAGGKLKKYLREASSVRLPAEGMT